MPPHIPVNIKEFMGKKKEVKNTHNFKQETIQEDHEESEFGASTQFSQFNSSYFSNHKRQ